MSTKESSENLDYTKFHDSNHIIDDDVPEDENIYTIKQKKTPDQTDNPFKKSEKLLVATGIALICVIILFLIFNPFNNTTDNHSEIENLKNKIQTLENKITVLDTAVEKNSQLEQQLIDLQHFYDTYHKRDAALSMQIDLLQKKVTQLEQVKTVVPKKNKVTATTRPKTKTAKYNIKYHIVKKGETFYGISRKYNLKLESLKKYNKLSQNSVLQPGQKLMVGYK